MTSFSKRQLTSILFAALFWGIVMTFFIIVPVKTAVEEPVYREIHIQLAPLTEKEPVPVSEPEPLSEPVSEPVMLAETSPVQEVTPVPDPVPAPQPAKAESSPVPVPAAAPVAPAAPSKAEPAPVLASPAPAAKAPEPAPAQQTLVKSVDQLMAEQAASRGTKKSVSEVDWDALFGESSTASTAMSSGEKTFASQTGPAISGSAAAVTSDTGSSVAATGARNTSIGVSSETASALSSISNAAGNAVSESRTSGSVTDASEAGTEGISSDGSGLEWGSGGGRKLVRPKTTAISFTDEQKALVTASVRDIRISFTVEKDGTVQRKSIVIDKKASLPAEISQEIERQISEWIFETGTADGQAVFIYSIIKA